LANIYIITVIYKLSIVNVKLFFDFLYNRKIYYTMIENKLVSEFLDEEYKSYSHHVLENRAIPSCIDSFKPSQRKAIFVAERHVRNTFNKVATLAGKVISDAAYHHGNVSCEDAIVNMAKPFKNNLSLFIREGQFGSLYSPDASASRYISVKLSKNFDLVYKDSNLVVNREEDGIKVEPYYYLPIVPMVLVNGGSGVAVGFASNILNRNIKDVVTMCIGYLKNGKTRGTLTPAIEEFEGKFEADELNTKKWFIKGVCDKMNTSTVRVTSLPPSMTYQRFEDHLDKLCEKKKISNWENKGKGVIEYHVKFSRTELEKYSIDDLDKILKLTDQVTEIFTTLDETGKLKIFDTAEEILRYFIDFRLTYYQKRKDIQVEDINNKVDSINQKVKFITLINDGSIVINKKSKEDITKQIESHKLLKIDESYDYLLRIPLYSLTKEQIAHHKDELKTLKEKLKEVKNSVPKETYIEELEILKKQLK
jgi:DNA gyrase/topoisomerase IV subunit A